MRFGDTRYKPAKKTTKTLCLLFYFVYLCKLFKNRYNMKKYKELSIWFRFNNAILSIVNNRLSKQRVWKRMYAEKAKVMLERYVINTYRNE